MLHMCFYKSNKISACNSIVIVYNVIIFEQSFNCSNEILSGLIGRRIYMKKTYRIEVDCANCANLMEEATRKTAGVKDCVVNFMTQKMNVVFEDGADIDEVMQNVVVNCRIVEDDCEIYL